LRPRHLYHEDGSVAPLPEQDDETSSSAATLEKISSVENCYLGLRFYSRAGIERDTFQTKYAVTGDRNPSWLETFSTDPIRLSEILPGGLDPIERLEISLYDRRVISPATMLFSAVTETFFIAKVSIPLQLLRLHTINQWFVMEAASRSQPENWHVALHVNIGMMKKKRMST
jgi:hypothetical protein